MDQFVKWPEVFFLIEIGSLDPKKTPLSSYDFTSKDKGAFVKLCSRRKVFQAGLLIS